MPAPTTTRKRKSDTKSAGSSKKTRTDTAHASAVALVNAILANPDDYPISEDDDEVRKSLVELAQYARALEEQAAASAANAGAGADAGAGASLKKKSPEELEEAAEKVRKAANSGISKQMGWKPSCKTGSARWVYDGICPDPEVFGCLMGLDGPPTWKMKKFSKDDFEARIGSVTASKRYNVVGITSDVNVRWSETGEFKFSGKYGI